MSKQIEPIQIQLPLDFMFQSVNCYLIPGEQLTLIDCGIDTEENWIEFQKQVKSNGFHVSDIEQVIITHEHRDHIGLLSKIMAASNPIVKVPRQIEKWFSDPEGAMEKHINFFKSLFSKIGLPELILEKSYEIIAQIGSYHRFDTSTQFEFFEDGDILHFGNTEWEALNTPGHCPNQFVFIQKEQKRIAVSYTHLTLPTILLV